ncbi:MAG TPA: DUF927 domain-containing protein [Arsenophonus nasoniae]|uniref:DUF927 domain-containing protein n=1 Tax=Arsenophonus nasoniae TaxID=638 RepID=UPI0038790FFA
MTNKIYYSRGAHRYDTPPEQRCAENEDQFIEQLLSDTASAKYLQYFCAPMNSGEHPRSKDPKEKNPERFEGIKNWRLQQLAANRRFISFDCDEFDSPKTFNALVEYLKQRFKGFLYTTFNYTQECPRCRFVLLLDTEVSREEGLQLCYAVENDIDKGLSSLARSQTSTNWNPCIKWDSSVYLAEQQCYLPIKGAICKKTKTGQPVTDAIAYKFKGDLVNVTEYLSREFDKETPLPRKYSSHSDDEANLDRWFEVDEYTLSDLRDALFFPPMIAISNGGRSEWQKIIAGLGSLKDTPYEDEAYQLALSWSEAGEEAFEQTHFDETWHTSRADLTSYKAVFAKAARLGWINPQILRPYLDLKKVGLYMTEEGLKQNIEEGTGKNKTIVAKNITAHFSIIGLTRDAYSDNWGKLITFKDRDDELKQFVVPDEQLHKQGSDIPQRLANLGLWININKSRVLLEYLNVTSAKERITLADTTGWFCHHTFVLPDKTLGRTDKKIMYRMAGRKKTENSQLSQKGTLEDWQQHIASKCRGNTRLLFSVCVALAAPLLDILGVDGGVFSLKGASTKGKSTAQHVAASVWGSGATTGGYSHSCNTSLVGIEVLATAHNDLPLILDELKSANPKLVGQIAYMLALGQGKVRGTKEVTLRDTLQWRTLVLASSEDDFENYLKIAGEPIAAGQQARFVDIPAIVSDKLGVFDTIHGVDDAKTFADSLNSLTTQYYGTAGIYWLEKLTHAERSTLIAKLTTFISAFKKQYRPENASSQLDRVLERFALCAAAGELAIESGVVKWKAEECIWGVGECFNSYVEERGTVGDLESVNGINQLIGYLSTYKESRFRHVGSPSALSIFDGYYIASMEGENSLADGFGETERVSNDSVYWITPDALKNRILANCNLEMTLAELYRIGALIDARATTDAKGRYKIEYNPRVRDPFDRTRRRYYRIDEEKLNQLS